MLALPLRLALVFDRQQPQFRRRLRTVWRLFLRLSQHQWRLHVHQAPRLLRKILTPILLLSGARPLQFKLVQAAVAQLWQLLQQRAAASVDTLDLRPHLYQSLSLSLRQQLRAVFRLERAKQALALLVTMQMDRWAGQAPLHLQAPLVPLLRVVAAQLQRCRGRQAEYRCEGGHRASPATEAAAPGVCRLPLRG